MNPPELDYAAARELMVDGQVRPNKVSDPKVVNAMRLLARERFLPPQLRALAYIDEDLPLGGGRVLMEPLIVARLIQALRPKAGQRALVIGSGCGYGAALLAACGPDVTALEEDDALIRLATPAFASLPAITGTVKQVSGPLAAGWPAGAPFDLILIEGGVRGLPPGIGDQLRPDGLLATVIVYRGNAGQAVLAEKVLGGLRSLPIFDCATPLLPQLVPQPQFVF